MTIEFLSDGIWPRLRRLAKARSRGPAQVAVPFLGRGAAGRLPLRDGDVLVTRFNRTAVSSGHVDPREVVTFIKRGVEVHNWDTLHAKVYVFGNTAFVGSANVSADSENRLVEAGCLLTRSALAKACRAFVLGRRGDVVGLEAARRLIPYWKPPKPFLATSVTKSAISKHRFGGIGQSDVVMVPLEGVDYDDVDRAASGKALASSRLKLSDAKRFRVDDFRWWGELPKAVKPGVRVLMCTEGNRGRIFIAPPSTVLEIRRYKSRRGSKRAIVTVELRKHVRERALPAVLKKLRRVGAPLRPPHRTKVLRANLVYRLGQLWPSADST